MFASSSPAAGIRLRGEVDGVSVSFVLGAGSHSVGSDPGCDVVLSVRGVSRRHARLEVSSVGVEVVDLDSKNGSFVNDRESRGRLALVGDELRFGPVTLRLQDADPEEAMLGLAIDPNSRVYASVPSLDTTRLTHLDSSTDEVRLDAVEAILDRLVDLPTADIDGALCALAARLGATAAAWIEWPRQTDDPAKDPVVSAAWGSVGAVPPVDQLPMFRDDRLWQSFELVGGLGAVRRRPGADGRGLMLWSDAPRSKEQKKVLLLAARLLDCFQPRPTADLEAPQPISHSALRLPSSVVRGESPAMVALYQQMQMLLQGDVPVLILGETGVGKEHLARTLHRSSSRCKGPFVAINCAAIPNQLLEAEMFGIGKGVATGVQSRRGKFSEAQGGTLFLDEIGDMSVELQAKLLRALQEKEIHPLGRAAEPLDVRVVAATNTDLRRRIEEDRFRQDLYFRLAGYVLEVPPLRHREEDVPRLVGHFLRRFCAESRKPVRGLTVKALRALSEYSWPGNVRELEHEIRRLVYVCPAHQAVDSEMLSEHILRRSDPSDDVQPSGDAPDRAPGVSPEPAPVVPWAVPDVGETGLEDALECLEKQLIADALKRTAGNQSAAARFLKVSRNGLAKRLKRLGLDASRFQI